MRLTLALLVGLLLTPMAQAGRCPKVCKQLLHDQLKQCRAECAKGRAGRACRAACVRSQKANAKVCRSSTDPLPPSCGATPVITSTTSSTAVPATSSSTSTASTTSSTTTTCVPATTCPGGTECGTFDDGCGGSIPCGACPAETPVCIQGSCHDSCAAQANGTPCDTDGNQCTIEQCSGGSCQATSFVVCLTADPCYSHVACDPGTGACVSDGYVGDGHGCGGIVAPPGVCAFGSCHTGKACIIDGVLYESGDLNPDFPCTACQPGYDQTAWTPVTDGIACPSGFCVLGACSSNVCESEGDVYPIGSPKPNDPCQTCQLGPTQTAIWAPLPNGTACDGGICLYGSCNTTSCLIDGTAYPDGASEFFFSHGCQKCKVSSTRLAWSTVPNGSSCGCGGFCSFGACSVIGQPACGGTDCRVGVCDAASGTCQTTPINVGGPCSQPSSDGCTATTGTCDAAGNCVRAALVGQGCVPPGPQGNPCWSTVSGKCDASGACVADWLPGGTTCTPPAGSDLCWSYACSQNTETTIACQQLAPKTCPAPGGCGSGVCDPATGICQYGPYPNGTRVCDSYFSGTKACCPDQVCEFPANCVVGCLEKFCYYPGSNH